MKPTSSTENLKNMSTEDKSIALKMQIKDAATCLLSFRVLKIRMSQIDRIIRRKADKVLFTMNIEDKCMSAEENSSRREKIVSEFLGKVKKRRKMIRSYTYLSWFGIFFLSFLGSLFLKEDNSHLYAVDYSIRNRVVDILPLQDILFYDWLGGVVDNMFPSAICGNGICESPDEYPGFGRFGCVSDCGRYLQRTSIRIDVVPAWKSRPGGLILPGFVIGSGDNVNVNFSFNIYSETLKDYLFAEDVTQASAIADVPDGNLWLELYQTESLFHDTPVRDVLDYAQVARSSSLKPNKLFEFQYGDPAEALASVAQINRQLHQYCTIDNDGSSQFASCPANYDPAQFGDILRNRYGLAGNISVSQGTSMKTILSFTFCSLTPKLVTPDQDPALIDPRFCTVENASSGPASAVCYDGKLLSEKFICKWRYPFSIWSFGSPRNVSVRPQTSSFQARTLTSFNNIIGSIIISQYRRKDVNCTSINQAATSVLTGQYMCQAPDRGDSPFGVDPVFQKTSSLYNGKLSISEFYADNERTNTGDPNASHYPFAFFPHQWGKGDFKSTDFISPQSMGVYKLYFDSRLSPQQARKLVQFMRDGMFISDNTEKIELEFLTYNPDFNSFGILTMQFSWDLGGGILWSAQYNTAQLSPYSGLKGYFTILLESVFGIMLLVDIVRESRDIYLAILQEELVLGYIMKFWNWVDWSHYSLLGTSLGLWIVYNQYILAIKLKTSYSVLSNLNGEARVFATDASNEFEYLEFTKKMRMLAEIKNLYTAINCLSILFFVFRILKILDFQPRMSLVTRTLALAGKDLCHFFALYLLIFAGYASVGTFMFGARLLQFQNFSSSCCGLFMIFLGWEPMYQMMASAVKQTNIQSSSAIFLIFYWSWVLISTFLMLNILLAVIVDAYASVKGKMKDTLTIPREAAIFCREMGASAGTKCCGGATRISDAELEEALTEQNRIFRSSRCMMDTIGQLRAKSKAVRLPGGFEVSEIDFADFLLPKSDYEKTSFKANISRLMSERQNMSSQQSVKLEDGVEIAADTGWSPPAAITNLIKRYGESVVEGRDDREFLELIQTENMKRQMAIHTSQQEILQKVEMASEGLDALVHQMLSTEQQQVLQTSLLLKNAKDQLLSLEVRDILQASAVIPGTLKLTVVSAKRLPKLDIFTESDPYCILLIEDFNQEGLEAPFELVGQTEPRKDDANPIWNSEFEISLQCRKGTILTAVIVDKDENGGDDLIGHVRLDIAGLPLGKEVDKWYHIRNEVTPALTKRSMIRIKAQFSPGNCPCPTPDPHGIAAGSNTGRCSPIRRPSAQAGPELEAQLRWLNGRLGSSKSEASLDCYLGGSGPRTLEVTLVCARHLPRRDAFFMKVDPYVKIAFNGVEHASLVRKRTYSPEWQQSFLFHVKEVAGAVGCLHAAVMDWDRFSRDDIIGYVEVSERAMRNILGQDHGWASEQTLTIRSDKRTVTGHDGRPAELTLRFRVTWPADGAAAAAALGECGAEESSGRVCAGGQGGCCLAVPDDAAV